MLWKYEAKIRKLWVLHILFVLEKQVSHTGSIKHHDFVIMGLIQLPVEVRGKKWCVLQQADSR